MNFSCLVPVFLQESPSNAFATERIRDSRTKKKKIVDQQKTLSKRQSFKQFRSIHGVSNNCFHPWKVAKQNIGRLDLGSLLAIFSKLKMEGILHL